MDEKVYSVAEISREIKQLVEQYIPTVWVEGEVSNYSMSRAGHIYFSLKDEQALISCVVWRNVAASLPYRISDGMHLLVRGDITTYQLQSRYQITVYEIRATGTGALYMAFEALKQQLSEEGLFDEQYKKPIPAYPTRIGIVTSKEGAALRDILQVSRRRNPSVKIVIYPALVQGKQAAETIIAGIQVFNRLKNVDFIIIGRGGGSMEDLWAFNEERLVRAVFESELPIVSAVGHEIDFTLSDFVADVRAPTPSAAAELAFPDRQEIETRRQHLQFRIFQLMEKRIGEYRHRIDLLQRGLRHYSPLEMIYQKYQRLDEIEKRQIYAVRQAVHQKRLQLDALTSAFQALNPKQVLKRGYAIVYKRPERAIVKSIAAVAKGQKIAVEISDGAMDATVENTHSK